MSDLLLTLDQAAEIVPLSKTTLYRVATEGGGPFQKIRGRWLVYESELHEWVRSHRAPAARGNADPMPRRARRQRGKFRETVVNLDSRRAASG